jgi:uncharacterized protein involved in exopolysaccharide biosynthesis
MVTSSLAYPQEGFFSLPLKASKRHIAQYALWGSLAFGLYGFFTPRDFLATTSLLLTPKAGQSEANSALIDGQKQLIVGDNLLRQLIEREKLTLDKEFGLKAEPLHISFYNALTQTKTFSPQERAKYALMQAIHLKQNAPFTLDIGVASQDGVKAARLANSLTQLYLEGQFGIGQSNNRAYAARITARLEELSKSLRLAEEHLYKLKASSKTGDAEGEMSFTSNQLAIARAKAAELRERVEKFTKFQRTGGDVVVMIQALNAPSLETMRAQTLELMRQEGELLQTLLPKHPQVLAVQKQINDSKTTLSNEVARVGNALKADLDVALTNEKSLAGKLETLRQATGGLSPTGQALREAEREVETQKALYTALLLRTNDNREAAEPIQASLMAEAFVPTKPQGLPLSLWAGLGLLLGGLIGFLRQLSFRPHFKRKTKSHLPQAQLEGVKTLVLSSTSNGQKHAQKALSLAQEAVARGENLLLIEADKAMPLSQLLLSAPQAGFAEWVRGEKTLDEVVIYDSATGLSFLPYGLQEVSGVLTPMQLSRLKLFSHLLMLTGEGDNLTHLNALNPTFALLSEKRAAHLEASLEGQKQKLQAQGLQLSGVVYA